MGRSEHQEAHALGDPAPRALRPPRERYQSEIEYFDREAEEAARALGPIDPLVIERFSTKSRPRFNKEFRLSLLAPLSGKHVLEIGCGDGESAVLLAKLGATVTGVDISPKAVELARARLADVSDNTEFYCAPLGHADLPESAFDAVWGDGILHHVIDDLESVMQGVVRWAKPGAPVIFAEPVNLSPALHTLRTMVPVPPEGTPDERPLEPAELATIARHVPNLQTRGYLLFGRLAKFILVNENYERSPLPRRAIANALTAVDAGILGLPWLKRLSGQLVMYGTAEK